MYLDHLIKLKSEKKITIGHKATGINTLFQTGDIFNVLLKEYFTDIDIYDDNLTLQGMRIIFEKCKKK